MTKAEHPAPRRLRRFLQGRLENEDARVLLAHLESCRICQDLGEKIWADESPLSEELDAAGLDTQTSQHLERGLFRRAHRIQLVENVLIFGFSGFFFLLVKFFAPLLDTYSRNLDERRSP